MSQIRALAEADIAELVRLRSRCFSHTAHSSTSAQEIEFMDMFFRNPWHNDDIPSLVCEGENGSLVGFLGVLARPISYQGERLWMAIPTQLMSDPEFGGMSGLKLLKKFLAGVQDLSFADAANANAKKIWEVLGGAVAPVHSLTWTRPLRPCRALLCELGSSRITSFLSKAALPVAMAMDSVCARSKHNSYKQRPTNLEERNLDVSGLLQCYLDLNTRYALSPYYDESSLGWLLQKLQAGDADSNVRRVALHDVKGELVGWYLSVTAPGGVSQTIQVGCRREDSNIIFQHLHYDAWQTGAYAISGRVQPDLLEMVAQPPGRLSRQGPWTLVHSKNPEIVQKVLEGDAWLTRLEGEWWMNF